MKLQIRTGDKRVVAALLVVLVATVTVTVLHMKRQGVPPVIRAQVAMAGDRTVSPPVEVTTKTCRNPFLKPERLRAGSAQDDEEAGVEFSLGARGTVPSPMPPMPVREMVISPPMITSTEPTTRAEPPVAEKREPTKFTLLATVQSAERLCGVIKAGDAEPKIAGIGDALEGGFVVKILSHSQAVLTNGREVVIAEKPESQLTRSH
jgi:hypothetical protein